MPNTSSAKKALRQNKKRRLQNRTQRTALRNVLKNFRAMATSAEKPEGIEQAFRAAVKKLDQSAAKNLIHKNTASRLKSRLSKLVPRRKPAATEG